MQTLEYACKIWTSCDEIAHRSETQIHYLYTTTAANCSPTPTRRSTYPNFLSNCLRQDRILALDSLAPREVVPTTLYVTSVNRIEVAHADAIHAPVSSSEPEPPTAATNSSFSKSPIGISSPSALIFHPTTAKAPFMQWCPAQLW